MVMTEVLDKLKELQDILAEKNVVEAKIKESPGVLSSQEELLARMKREYIEKDNRCQKCKQDITHLQAELFEAESARERAEKAMDTITTQREYEALDKEIKDAQEKEQTVRKEIQKLDRQYQGLDEELKGDEEQIKSQESELEQRKARLEEEIAKYNEELEELKKAEENVSPGIDPETKFKLERIIKSKQGVGVVAINGNVCTGCHMILPAQFANDVRTGEGIQYCPYCSRILYYVESADGENSFFDNEDAGSLADLDDFSDDEEIDDEMDDEIDGEKMTDYED